MIDVKCKGCDKLLGKATIMVAALKCPRCYLIFEYHIYTNTLQTYDRYGINDNRESTETIEHTSQ